MYGDSEKNYIESAEDSDSYSYQSNSSKVFDAKEFEEEIHVMQ